MVALKLSETELTDLIKVKSPWSVPTASESIIYLFIELFEYLFAAKAFSLAIKATVVWMCFMLTALDGIVLYNVVMFSHVMSFKLLCLKCNPTKNFVF